MKISLNPVTAENRRAAEKLELLPEQVHFIESVAECLQEADQLAEWHPVCIMLGQTMIGFSMYGYFEEEGRGRLWFDRFLIDYRYQGRGFGKMAMQAVLNQMHNEYPPQEIYLSVYDDNPVAIQLYRTFGFEFNGELDTKGEKIMALPNAGKERT